MPKRNPEIEEYLTRLVAHMDQHGVQASDAIEEPEFSLETLTETGRLYLARQGAISLANGLASRDRHFAAVGGGAGRGAVLDRDFGASPTSSPAPTRRSVGVTSPPLRERMKAALEYHALTCISMEAADGSRKYLKDFKRGDWEHLAEKSAVQSDAWTRRRKLAATAITLLTKYNKRTANTLPKAAKRQLDACAQAAFTNAAATADEAAA